MMKIRPTKTEHESHTITLTREQGKRFLQALETPRKPSARLRRAARKLDKLGIK